MSSISSPTLRNTTDLMRQQSKECPGRCIPSTFGKQKSREESSEGTNVIKDDES
jgi:hypothetical protein